MAKRGTRVTVEALEEQLRLGEPIGSYPLGAQDGSTFYLSVPAKNLELLDDVRQLLPS